MDQLGQRLHAVSCADYRVSREDRAVTEDVILLANVRHETIAIELAGVGELA